MANSPFKMKNALGNNMAQDNKSKGQPAGGSMFGQGFVPGGKQAPYWQTQDMAVTPSGTPMQQYAISNPVPAPAVSAVNTSNVGKSFRQQGIQGETLPFMTEEQILDYYGGVAQAGLDNFNEANPGYNDQAAAGTGNTNPAPLPAPETVDPNAARFQSLWDQYMGGVGQTDWDQQKNAAIAQMQAQAGQQRLALQNAMAAAGGTASSGASGAYMGGMGQLGFNQQMALGNVLAELQKNKAAEDNARFAALAQLAGQMGDYDMQKQLLQFQQGQASFENLLTLGDTALGWLRENNMFPGEDPYADEYFQMMTGMSVAEYMDMIKRAAPKSEA